MEKVIVLMSTYNGEKYLREQIESILAQSFKNLELFIRDDGSYDGTVEILKEYAANIRVSWFQGKNLKPAQSFLELVKRAPEATFYAFADQDDVWDVNKIEVAVKKLSSLPSKLPTLYCSAIRIVDQNLNAISAVKYNTNRKISLGESYVQTIAPGCTFVFNNTTKNYLHNFNSSNLMMHDTLVMNVVSAFGKVIYDSEPHMSYRQHESNVIGSPKSQLDKLIRVWTNIFFPKVPNFRYRMALAMEENFANLMDVKTLYLTKLITGYRKNLLSKLKLAFNKEIRTTSRKSNVILLLQILIGKF